MAEDNDDARGTPTMSLYEQSREKRIKENLERMQKMGILDITQKLRSAANLKRNPGNKLNSSAAKRRKDEVPGGGVFQSAPLRRSSRLQNATPVIYSDVLLRRRRWAGEQAKRRRLISGAGDKQILFQEGPKPELYTEEHEKLLGNTERSWELFVDGYGKDGRRIYDQFKGKTCHQCRQKTLGQRTQCSQCNMVQGQFCGDCLYMRYGEHVLEALANPNWICPVCRGICNCSLCRQAKGWPPTGPLYRKITSMGFKSVAHYLIQTRRSQSKEETSSDSPPAHILAKRSLPFSNSDSKEPSNGNIEDIKPVNLDVDPKEEENSTLTTVCSLVGHVSTKRSLCFISEGNNAGPEQAPDYQKGDEEHSESDVIIVSNSSVMNNSKEVKKRPNRSVPNLDSIGGRLRLRKSVMLKT